MNEAVLFLLKTLGLGLLTGFLIGYLFKKISKLLILILAIGVVAVFLLGHNEILEINWLAIKESGQDFFSGMVDKYGDRIEVFLRNLPFVIGLIVGGLIGLNKG
ncbi:MAG: FUN14 domain-containing protein [bacterium]